VSIGGFLLLLILLALLWRRTRSVKKDNNNVEMSTSHYEEVLRQKPEANYQASEHYTSIATVTSVASSTPSVSVSVIIYDSIREEKELGTNKKVL
jgi:hypothetical protein